MSINCQTYQRKRGPRFKINREQAKEVMVALETEGVTMDEIARQWRVTKQTIYNVLRRLRREAVCGVDPRWK